ncbi:MAG TPA: flagellar basal body P-ring formation chaperone FlgA [Tepidisphaeraceae bacterium]|jgi:flagella basal body P-ring formation protein FlgA
MRKRIQVMVAVILLAWATQTLVHQWGFGAELPRQDTAERFVPGTDRYVGGATLEMRGDATIVGSEVKLKQVCRWSDSDAAVFVPVADLVVLRLSARSPFKAITVDQIRSTLHDAGVNLGVVKFSGPMSCTIGRSDTQFDEQSALRQWAAAKSGDTEEADVAPEKLAPAPVTVQPPSTLATPTVAAPAIAREEKSPVKTLRSLLVEDLAVRLNIPAEQLQVNFNPKDENLLHMSEPLFKFNIDGHQVHDLGDVTWSIQILTGNGSQKGVVTATAWAWQNQLVIEKSLGYHQVIRSSDVAEHRVLIDRMPSEQLLTASQVVGQEAARDLKVGTIVSARMVDAISLVKTGQLITITLNVGTVRVKTVGRAMESGCYGQAVKVRNDATQDIFEVTLTGPQEGTIGPMPGMAVAAAGEK